MPHLSLKGGTKEVFGLSLMFAVSPSVRGRLPSWVTCFHQEVDVRVVLLGWECVFRRAERSYGECLGEDVELSENKFVLLFVPLQLSCLSDGPLLKKAWLGHVRLDWIPLV